jgi:hypothetical protein
MQVPVDGRPQLDLATLVIANHSVGRMPFDGVETTTPDGRYILKNSWPPPKPSDPWSGGGFSGLTAAKAPVEASSSPQARSLWPQLR